MQTNPHRDIPMITVDHFWDYIFCHPLKHIISCSSPPSIAPLARTGASKSTMCVEVGRRRCKACAARLIYTFCNATLHALQRDAAAYKAEEECAKRLWIRLALPAPASVILHILVPTAAGARGVLALPAPGSIILHIRVPTAAGARGVLALPAPGSIILHILMLGAAAHGECAHTPNTTSHSRGQMSERARGDAVAQL
jgi:hypothetical protein